MMGVPPSFLGVIAFPGPLLAPIALQHCRIHIQCVIIQLALGEKSTGNFSKYLLIDGNGKFRKISLVGFMTGHTFKSKYVA